MSYLYDITVAPHRTFGAWNNFATRLDVELCFILIIASILKVLAKPFRLWAAKVYGFVFPWECDEFTVRQDNALASQIVKSFTPTAGGICAFIITYALVRIYTRIRIAIFCR